jgi:serine/threonine protein kinase
VKLLDFGAARFAAGEHSRSLSIILKPGYAPEEQYRSRGKQGPWTDVYGLAATLYRAITGTVPPEALDRLDQDDLVAPSRLGIPITAGQEAVLLKALAVKADARYPTMQGLLDGWGEVENAKAEPLAGASPPAAQRPPPTSSTPAPVIEQSLPKSPILGSLVWFLAVVVIGGLSLEGISQFFGSLDRPSAHSQMPRNVMPRPSPITSDRISERYRPLGADGSIIEDQTTGLQWMRCSQGQHWEGVNCNGDAATLTWEEAMQQSRGFSFAGYTDWRVPTKDELRTLVYCSSGRSKTLNDTGDYCAGDYKRPTIDQAAFPGTPDSWFWSSSPDAYPSVYAWYVDFYYGYVYKRDKSISAYVRLVRAGQ